jgi:S1-C subfamily serine protease
MPDRPEADQTGQPASYSPPPLPRPDRFVGFDRQPSSGTSPSGSAWRRSSAAVGSPWIDRSVKPPTTARAAPARRQGLGGLLLAAVAGALVAVFGMYTLLLVGGHLDRQVFMEPPLGQQAGVQRGSDPDVVRVVEENAVTAAVDKVSPAVVTITPQGRLAGTLYPEGVGSGVIFDADGWIVTNRHVVCDADSLAVQLADGQHYQGSVYGLDTLTDLAIVRVEAQDLPAVEMGNSDTLRVGQHAIAIGSPLGTFTNSVTTGVVSAMGRRIDVADACSASRQLESLRDLIQTDAAINPGNSGGALVDVDGALIGINTAIAGDAQGIGFAIPINLARPIMQQALEGELLSRPWMGIWYTALTPLDRDRRDLLLGYGALIEPPEGQSGNPVIEDSPADEAGLRVGDIITHVDGIKVDGEDPLDEILTQYRPNETVDLRVLRGEEVLDLQMELGTRPPNQ